MKELAEFLAQPWIGTIIGVVGIVIATILAFSYRPRPRLAAQINTLDLVGPNAVLPDGIEFVFRGSTVPKVTLSRIALWNIGNTTIRRDQIVGNDPLRIALGDNGSVLETSVLAFSRKANDVTCFTRAQTVGEVECTFDYLDPNDGALIQIIHTGTNSLSVLGTLRGVPKGVLRIDTPQKKKEKQTREMSAFAARLIALILGFVGLVVIGIALRGNSDWPLAGIGVTVTAAGVVLLVALRRLPPSELNPQITSNEPKKGL
ncbi:MAG: hypothetical protein JWL97_724 [Gemmatimonadales bacterium]|nr:hypothetical protein [Gemmatimonadales bacterium]